MEEMQIKQWKTFLLFFAITNILKIIMHNPSMSMVKQVISDPTA